MLQRSYVAVTPDPGGGLTNIPNVSKHFTLQSFVHLPPTDDTRWDAEAAWEHVGFLHEAPDAAGHQVGPAKQPSCNGGQSTSQRPQGPRLGVTGPKTQGSSCVS